MNMRVQRCAWAEADVCSVPWRQRDAELLRGLSHMLLRRRLCELLDFLGHTPINAPAQGAAE